MSTGHIRQRSAGSWEIKWDAGTDPLTGRRRTRFATVKGTKRDAQRALRERLGAVDRGEIPDAGKMTLGQYLEQWLTAQESQVSAKTHERYSELVRGHLIPGLGAVKLGQLRAATIEAFYADRLKSGRKNGKGGLSPRTVRHLDRVLNAALRRARRLDLIASNPVELVERPAVQPKEIEVLDPRQAAMLLKTAEGTRLRTPLFLALATGLRRGELLALRWRDLDLDRGQLTVAQALEQTTAHGLRFKAPKTRRSRRTVKIGPAVVEEMRAHKRRQAEERLRAGLGKDELDLVFATGAGAIVDPRTFSKEFARLVAKAGVPAVGIHALRHTHFTELLKAGIHPKVAADRAGHASVAVTMDIYSHIVPGLQEGAALQIDGALRTLLEQ